MEIYHEDLKSLLSQVKHQEKQIRLKRRWLMGLPLSNSERKQVEEIKLQKNWAIPESLLREDDVYYETIRTTVEKGFGACKDEKEHSSVEDNLQLSDLHMDLENIFPMLDSMTNKGLCRFASTLAGGSTMFLKTRWKMEQFIKEHLRKIIENCTDLHTDIMKNLCQLLNDPHYFRDKHIISFTPASQSHHTAVVKVLNGLEDLPSRILKAMHRKLRGIKGYVPHIQPPKKCGWGRAALIDQIRKSCLQMLAELNEDDELQEPLAKAMAVAGLTSKLVLDFPSVTEFVKISPQIEELQNDIAKAIWLLKKKVRFMELKNLQFLLDPNAELSNRSLRTAVTNFLTEFLVECADIDTIPECLLQTLAIINKGSRSSCRSFSTEEMEEEIECLLSVSAQTKQIVWNLLPEHEFDHDFADAYMEELEETDDLENHDEGEQLDIMDAGRLHCGDSRDQIESTGDNMPTNSKSCASSMHGDKSRLEVKVEPMHINEIKSVDSYVCASSLSFFESKFFESPHNVGGIQNLGLNNHPSLTSMTNCSSSSPYFTPDGRSNRYSSKSQDAESESEKPSNIVPSEFSCGGSDFVHDKESVSKNHYLAVQGACDETSMFGRRLIGLILDEFAHMDGLELEWGDISYLRDNDLVRRNTQVTREKQASLKEDARGSAVVELLEDLFPSFPESGKEKLKLLLNLK